MRKVSRQLPAALLGVADRTQVAGEHTASSREGAVKWGWSSRVEPGSLEHLVMTAGVSKAACSLLIRKSTLARRRVRHFENSLLSARDHS